MNELNKGHQGWVDLNFVVTEEGEVIEPVVEASSGSRAFERAALRTVKRWRYEPALLNGVPVEQCKTAVRISFAIEGSESGVSRRFYRQYRRIAKDIEQENIESASSAVDDAFQAKGLTLGELSWLWVLRARIAWLRGDEEQQLIAVRRALAVSRTWIPDQLRADLLTTQVVLEFKKGDYAMALSAHSDLKTIEGSDTSGLDPVIEKIRTVVDSDQYFFSAAEIGRDGNCETCESQWQYRPLRRAIEITDIDGTLGNLELRCEWRRYVDEAREKVAWKIPASWGECSVVVHGEAGSTFKLVELPDA
jgi:TonB family protein